MPTANRAGKQSPHAQQNVIQMPGMANLSSNAPKLTNLRTPQNNNAIALQPLPLQQIKKKEIQNILTSHD